MRARTEMPAGGGEHEDATLRLVIETLKRGGEGTQQIYIEQVVGRPLDLHGRHKTLIKYEVPGRVEVAIDINALARWLMQPRHTRETVTPVRPR